jgi:hypothetical protein
LLPLIIGVPLLGALACLGLRGRPRPATVLAVGCVLLALAALLAAPDSEVTLLGLTYRLDPPRRLAGLALLGAMLTLLGLDRLVGRGRKFAAVSLAVAGAGAGALLVTDPRAGAVLLLGASAAALFALVDRPLGVADPAPGIGVFRIPPWAGTEGGDLPPVPALDAALKYLALMVLAAVAFVVAFVLLDRYRLEPEQTIRLKLVLGFLVVGLGLRLGAAPLHAWVGDLAAHTPPAAASLVLVALNGVTVFFAARVLAENPALLRSNPLGRDLLLIGAIIGVGLAGLLAWSPAAQADPRRLVGAAAVGQVGFALFGLAVGSRAGFAGALISTLAAGAGLALALGAAGLIADRRGSADPTPLRGLGRDAPLLAVTLALGLAMLLGLPPLGGFAGRVLVLQAAAGLGPGWPWVAGLVGGLALLTAAVLRALAPLWIPPAAVAPGTAPMAVPARLWLGLLAAGCLALGLFPAPLLEIAHAWAGGAPYLILP